MARIGKTVDISQTSFETVASTILEGMALNAITGVNWTNNKANKTINIYGESADLTTLKAHANSKGLVFDILGDAPPEPVDTLEPPPTQDEIDARAFMKTAFGEMKTEEKNRLLTILQTKYDAINTTPIAFADVPKGDFKWLR